MKTEGPRATIIIPVFNSESTIKKCVESALEQDEKNVEIILVDDGSSDNSPKLCDELARRDDRIKVIHGSNTGAAKARNVGIEAASGKWIIFLDSDDWLEHDAASFMCDMAEENDSDIFISSFFSENKKSVKESFFNQKELHFNNRQDIRLLQENCISRNVLSSSKASTNLGVPWAKVYRLDFVNANKIRFPENLRRTQDAIFNLNAFECAGKVDFIDKPIYHYRVSGASLSRRAMQDFENMAEQIEDAILSFIKNYGRDELLPAYYSKTIRLLIEITKIQIVPLVADKGFASGKRELARIAEFNRYKEAVQKVNSDNLGPEHRLFLSFIKRKWYRSALLICAVKRKIEEQYG